MPIDASIYQNMSAPDIMGGFERGMRLADLAGDAKAKKARFAKDQALDAAYKSGVTQNPDGTTSIDQGKTFSALAGVDPRAAQEYQRGVWQDSQTKMKADFEKVGMVAQLAGAAKDQNTWNSSRAQAIQMGLATPEELPEHYDKNFVDHIYGKAITARERMSQMNTDRDFGFKQSEAVRDQRNKDLDRLAKKEEAGQKKTGDLSKLASDLRKERSGLPTTRATQEVSAAYNKVQNAAKNPSAAGDLSLIFNYMKMLDPGSTVREGEFASAQNAAGVPDRILNIYEQVRTGKRLGPEQRADFVGQSSNIYRSQLSLQRQIDSQYGDYARKVGVDPRDVILNFEASGGEKPATVIQNGYTYTLNPKTGEYE